ncbi:CDP-archaeol synthase [bacterium]|jgi:hypothetical protein|nr:CDP-archaeol synthase [bacterium]
MLLKEILFFILPLLLVGLIHHLIIIKYNLFSFLAIPIDRNIKLNNDYLFGPAKTWRGIVTVVILSGIFYYLGSYFWDMNLRFPVLLSGCLLGLGYAVGELPNSFIKRRLGIQSSQSNYQGRNIIFYLFDQIDSILGALLFICLVYNASILLLVYILIIGSLLHYLVDEILHHYSYKKYNK